MKITHVYTYATGDRPDGYDYAIGVMDDLNKVIGDYALVRDRDAVRTMAVGIAREHGATVTFLGRSGEGGPTTARVGDLLRIEMGYSEVCMSMRVAGKVMTVQVLENGAQLYDDEGNTFSFPITHNEAGIRLEGN